MTQTALIVGASRGLGLGLVREYLARGWRVTATVRDPAGEAALRALPGAERLTVLHADVASDADAARLAEAVAAPLDLLLLNAGVMTSGDVSAPSYEAIDQAMRINAVGPARLAWALIDKVVEQTGVVAFMSTAMGSIAAGGTGSDVYRASKAAQNRFARSLWEGPAKARGVTVLSLHPGWVRTEMGGTAAPVEIADSCRGLADQIAANAGAHDHRFLDYAGQVVPW